MPRNINVNWEEVQALELIPEGRYATRIDKVEEKVGQSGDHNEYWQMTFTITEEPLIGRKCFGNFMLQPTALWKLRQLMKAIGIATDGVADISADDFEGQEVGVVVSHEEYQGEMRSRVQSFYSLVE